jgi:pilus assembly protein CpaB
MAERRYTTIFGAALATAALATFGIYRVLQASKAQNRIITRPVVIAAKDVSEGKPIDRASVTVAEWPVNTVPAGAFTSIDSVVNRVTRIDVFKGEVIVPGRLAPDGVAPGLQVKINPGKRALAVRIDDVSGLNGMIQPNSRVDVLVVTRDPSSQKDVAKLFMSNMRVLSVGTVVSQTASDSRPIQAPTVSLEVTPAEAERLAVAMGTGRIQLALRGYGDPEAVNTTGANSEDVLAQLRNAPVAKPDPAAGRHTAAPPARHPAPVLQAAPVVQAPPPSAGEVVPKSNTLDTNVVQIFKADKQDTRKFVSKADSAKADSAKRNKPPL